MRILQRDQDLRLRPVQLPEDARLALPWYADAEVMRLSEDVLEPYDEDTISGMYEYLLARGEAYIIEVREASGDWRAIGDIALTPETVPIVIGLPEDRNRGLGRRALELVIGRARDLGWAKLETKSIWTRNTRSRHVFESVGFKLVRVGPDDQGRESWFHRLDLGTESESAPPADA